MKNYAAYEELCSLCSLCSLCMCHRFHLCLLPQIAYLNTWRPPHKGFMSLTATAAHSFQYLQYLCLSCAIDDEIPGSSSSSSSSTADSLRLTLAGVCSGAYRQSNLLRSSTSAINASTALGTMCFCITLVAN